MMFVVLLNVAMAFPKVGGELKRPDSTPHKDKLLFFTQTPEDSITSTFLQLSQDISLQSLSFSVIDCIGFLEYCNDLGVDSYPTLKYITKHEVFNYTWTHTYEEYLEFSLKLSGESVTFLSNRESFNEFDKHQTSFILFFDKQSEMTKETRDLIEISIAYKQTRVYFGICNDQGILIDEGIEVSELPIIRKYGYDRKYKHTLKNSLSHERMSDFIKEHRCNTQLKARVSSLWELKNCFKGKIVGIVFFNSQGFRENGYFPFNELALNEFFMKTDSRLKYVMMEYDRDTEITELFGITNPEPAIIADFREGVKIYTYRTGEKFYDLNDLETSMENLWNGKIDDIKYINDLKNAGKPKLSAPEPVERAYL